MDGADSSESEIYSRILTVPPGPKAREKLAYFKQHTSEVLYNILPDFVPEKANGSIIEDVDGNRYVDFLTGVGVNVLGSSHPRVTAAIQGQIKRYMHMNTHVGPVLEYAKLIETLKGTMPYPLNEGTGFLCNSGTEAVEAAMKLARYVSAKPFIIALDPSFHGRTLGSLAATTGLKSRSGMESLLQGVVHAKYPYPYRVPEDTNSTDLSMKSIEAVLNDSRFVGKVSAIIIEPIAGEPGVIVPPEDFGRRINELVREYGILLIADEVQVGLGRTGKWWAIEHYGIDADIIVSAKALGGGLPLGGIIAKREISSKWLSGHHASTFGGNPVACSAGIATIETIKEKDLIKKAHLSGQYILNILHQKFSPKYALIGDVRGKGMLIGIELVTDKTSKIPATKAANDIKTAAFKHGLVISTTGTHGNVIRLAPAYNIRSEIIDEGLHILDEAFRQVQLN